MLTPELLKTYLPQATTEACALYAQPLERACVEFDINTNLRRAAFLAQVAHESGNLRSVRENLNYSADGLLRVFSKYFDAETAAKYARNPEKIANRVYAKRMGNGPEESGDGWLYRGRGLIQLTGKQNYMRCLTALGYDDPNDLETPVGAARSAGWFWFTRGLNSLADRMDTVGITKIINGGTHGMDDRLMKYNHILNVMGVSI